MGRYFIHLAYNGASYCGWQTQPELPTVQLTLEQALSTLLRQKVAVVGCGRTDTGAKAATEVNICFFIFSPFEFINLIIFS